jgi:hypothetical protein
MARPIWTTAAEVAEGLRETPRMRNFRQAFEDQDLRGRLSELTAIYSALREHEILVGIRLNQMGSVVESWAQSEEDRTWMEDAVESGRGFQFAIEYLRSYLPRYPYPRVPHLRRGSPLDFCDGPLLVDYFPWDREIRAVRIEPDKPPQLSRLGGGDFTDLLRELAGGLKERDSWIRFTAARDAMGEPDWDALNRISSDFSARVKREVVDAEAGHYLVDRFAYRMRELRRAVESTDGQVRQYLAAFEAVHELITVVAGFMETLIIKGHLPLITPYRMDIGSGNDLRRAELATLGDDPFHSGGGVLFVQGPDECSQGLLYATGHNHRWPRLDEPERSTMVVEGWFVREQIDVIEKTEIETGVS